jgi:hypothetical protein
MTTDHIPAARANGHAETSTGFAVGNEFPNGEAALDELVAIAQQQGMGYTKRQRLAPVEMEAVNRPAHYTQGGVEVIDIIEQITKDYPPAIAYHIGNCIKYLARAPHKGAMQQDLMKSEWYLRRAINQIAKRPVA